ncbi:MAG: PilW family protein [Gammaproteobacteria bacterium]|nr:PilW family protein [Gammaproteobacteria bacterium]
MLNLRRQRGLTIVEIMVSLLLGLLILGAAISIFDSNRRTYRTGEALARVQENGRYAIQTIARELRMAGHIGCGSRRAMLSDSVVFQLTNNVSSDPPDFDPTEGVEAFDSMAGWNGPATPSDGTNDLTICDSNSATCRQSDAIRIVNGSPVGFSISAAQASAGAALSVVSGVAADFLKAVPDAQLFLVTDCLRADVFRYDLGDTDTSLTPDDTLSQAYADGALIMPVVGSTYFVANDATDGVPSLYRLPFCDPSDCSATDAEEIAEGVEAMQVMIGIDSDEDSFADSYVTPAAVGDWADVASVRVSLLVRSEDNFVVDTPVAVEFTAGTGDADGDGETDTVTVNSGANADRRLRMVFTTTVGLRNHIP